MHTITFRIDDCVLERFPNIAVGGFLVTEVRHAGSSLASATKPAEAMESAHAALTARGITLERLAVDPRISEWRAAIASCGLKASTYKSSAEQLARRFLKRDVVDTALPVVNTYCAISGRHLAPLGGYDLDRLPDPAISLRMGCPSTDSFSPLGGRVDDMPITRSVVVYACGHEILCWAFNHRDSRSTCLTASTQAALFLGESIAGVQEAGMELALRELADVLKLHGAQAGGLAFANGKTPFFSISA